MTQPLVSVIVPVRNAARYLPAALDSLAQQTMADFEAIVVDDSSTDQSPAIAAAHAAADPRFKLAANAGRGVSSARNVGLEQSAGRFVAFLDADDLLPADSLAQRIAGLEACKGALAAGAWRVIGPEGENLNLPMGRTSGVRRFANAFDLSAHIGAVIGEGALLRQVRFDPAHKHGEDWEYLIKLLRGGALLHPLKAEVFCYRWRRASTVNRNLITHTHALIALLQSFAAPKGDAAAPGWSEASVRPRQLALLYDLALKLVLSDAEAAAVEQAAARCDALVKYAAAAPARMSAQDLWIAAVRIYLKRRGGAALCEQVCGRIGALLALAERLAAHRAFAAALRAFVDQALDGAAPAAA
ncbi:MAG: glycosyltransferase family 2 protein [Terricaulis sp.]|nr:glycosyltransferase family 2 protein [Terricaulis sp.]